ncbi:GPW/gp25 family protein [Agromyces sp. NPDC056379]|uniref:GPW/gp25 family protein n=1 Tax=unclassified Agromyces TaxID=2639701 RepID=UPI0035D7EEF0
MSRLAFPFRPTALGGSDAVDYGSDAHVRQLLELLVFTVPGERPMRGDLGSPVRQLVFGSAGGTQAIAVEAALQATVQQWLGHLLTLVDLTVTPTDDAALEVVITYETLRARTTGQVRVRTDLT